MIVIAGASGFVGGHLVDSLLSAGADFSCLARSETAANALRSRGCRMVVRADITMPETLNGVLRQGDFVIHLVGIIEEKGQATFQSIHVEGTRSLVAEAKRAGVRHFFYQSALGAYSGSWSGYLRTKAEAEEMVEQSGIPCTIFRPSLIIGLGDGFTRKLVDVIKLSPVVPMPGKGEAKFQPVYIKDWVRCMRKVIDDPEGFSGTYEIGGPEYLTYREIVEHLSKAMGYRKPVLSIPMEFVKLGASVLKRVMPSPPVTMDQLRLLEQDNIGARDAIERHFGFTPTRFDDMLREFIG
ncbi:MAG TPA: complex I NDUFA9 subunit family protein [Thermodesulfovibrionales bacterium]|nr:complex I NDUFA9 subunit family protein [Thermodesulfovibrionales bacterium]